MVAYLYHTKIKTVGVASKLSVFFYYFYFMLIETQQNHFQSTQYKYFCTHSIRHYDKYQSQNWRFNAQSQSVKDITV